MCSFFHTSWKGSSKRVTPNICPVNSLSGFTGPSPAPCTTSPLWTRTRTTQYWTYWSTAVTSLWVPALWAQSCWCYSVLKHLMSPLRTATTCSRRSLCAGCWSPSGSRLEDECFVSTSWSTSCTWSFSLLWPTIGGMERWAGSFKLFDSSMLPSQIYPCWRFISAPQNPFGVEHTTIGYLYITGQLLTALANVYFFIIGVWRFPCVLNQKSSCSYNDLVEVVFQYDSSQAFF